VSSLNGIRIVLAATLLCVSSVHAESMAPDEFIQDAVNILAEKIGGKGDELGKDPQALYALIDDLLLPRFDRRLAARQVLAKHWRTASEDQRKRFVDAFYTTLLQRYADGVLDFESDRIKVLPFRGDATKRYVTVKTRVDLDDGSNVSVNYTLVLHDTGWMMFDVTIEGVSYVRNFRAEFDSEIRASSLEDVVERLENEAADNHDG